jgi:hypothetical protein
MEQQQQNKVFENPTPFPILDAGCVNNLTYCLKARIIQPDSSSFRVILRALDIPKMRVTYHESSEKYIVDTRRCYLSDELFTLYSAFIRLLTECPEITELCIFIKTPEEESAFALARWFISVNLPRPIKLIQVNIGKVSFSIVGQTLAFAMLLCSDITPMVAALIAESMANVRFSRMSIHGNKKTELEEEEDGGGLLDVTACMLLEWIHRTAPTTLRLIGPRINQKFLEGLMRTIKLDSLRSLEVCVPEKLRSLLHLSDRGCALKRLAISDATPIEHTVESILGGKGKCTELMLDTIPRPPSREVMRRMIGIRRLSILRVLSFSRDQMIEFGEAITEMPSLETIELRGGRDYHLVLSKLTKCKHLRSIILDMADAAWIEPLLTSIPTLEVIRVGDTTFPRIGFHPHPVFPPVVENSNLTIVTAM